MTTFELEYILKQYNIGWRGYEFNHVGDKFTLYLTSFKMKNIQKIVEEVFKIHFSTIEFSGLSCTMDMNENYFKNLIVDYEKLGIISYNESLSDEEILNKCQYEIDVDKLHPNVCFSYSKNIDKDDKRQYMWKIQRAKNGFDNTELWNLDNTIVRFILPRLIKFKENNHTYPSDLDQNTWNDYLDKMIKYFQDYLKDDVENNEGWDLFSKYFSCLWI